MYFGWVKLHRQFLDWEWYKNSNTKSVFLHLLLSAGMAERKQQGFTLQAGELITTLPRLSGELGLTEKEVRTALNHLEKTGEISQKRTNKFRLITIEKWGFYQSEDVSMGSQGADKGQTKGRQRAGLEKEYKNKEYKNTISKGSAPKKTKKNRFINYTQREWNQEEWDEMERMDRENFENVDK